jgi:prepilin signal peptidase PulO-like enzyme (type II secretory pathway)
MALLNILIFIFGITIGSFLNVVIYRLKSNKSIIKNRSHCVFCNKKLDWFELIPIISFIIQKGKCRKCKKKIFWQYPLVEFFTGVIFVLVFSCFFDFTLFSIINIFFLLVISCLLIVIFVYDLKHYLILDKIIYPTIIIVFLYQLFSVWDFGNWNLFGAWSLMFGALLGGAFFGIIVFVSRGRWMGIGDIKLGFLMGLFLGLNLFLVALFVTFLSGAIISAILLALKKKKLKSEIPFGPFLVGATFISLFWGSFLSNWYFNLFL